MTILAVYCLLLVEENRPNTQFKTAYLFRQEMRAGALNRTIIKSSILHPE
ncbi:hypothetical protein CLV42_11844 [Chitinophaga ginsengisoli]|uniref:Uncharacterized protein n=1 Tax=Chitinophaga ginsengisoli TaxID=363837 RepID=A0A2P8FNQ0_9BACT|nr:hypothetical protein CLV42_11844 [Chitinophaga ginsengisoli]